jgi:ABC-type sugar transport system substrate-binding protein
MVNLLQLVLHFIKSCRLSRITIDATLVADWLRDNAEDAVSKYLAEYPGAPVDVVYAHNDPMALGAYWAVERTGREGVAFVGIDGLNGENGGIELVKKGVLEITFVYPTGGAEAVEYMVAPVVKTTKRPQIRRKATRAVSEGELRSENGREICANVF